MNNAGPIQAPMGNPPSFPNLYVLTWSLVNIAILIAIAVLIFRFVKQKNDYRQQMLDKLDSIILLLQQRKNDKQRH